MKLLVLGGTRFLGRAFVEAALARGHEVTLFNRGIGDRQLFPEVERLIGDRDGDLSALQGRTFDACIDTCGFVPRVVARSAQLLAAHVEHYTYISSASVYADLSQTGIDENAAVSTLSPDEVEAITRDTAGPIYTEAYGALKALCEQAAEAAMPGRVLHVRAGLIVGPHDYSDRFTYWPSRIARGGNVLLPEPPQRQLQFVDVRDLADWNLRLIEGRKTGVYNISGSTYTMQQFIKECQVVTRSEATCTYVSESFLEEQGVGCWIELPLWIPESLHEPGMMALHNGRAIASGAHFRPLHETIRDTWHWDQSRPKEAPRKAGLAAEKEQRLLALWHELPPQTR